MTDDSNQGLLFDSDPDWAQNWKEMPDFCQEDQEPLKQIIVSFATKEDIEQFSLLIGQTITMSTRSIWFPEAEVGHYANKRWVIEDEK